MNLCKWLLVVSGLCIFVMVMFLWNYAYFCGWHFEDSKTRFLLIGDPQIQGDSRILRNGLYGQIDVWYNDVYLRHVTDTLLYYLQPSHVFVVGDLFSSQYITNKEFAKRVDRYNWIYKNVKVPFYNLVGNHDIGYGSDITKERIERFIAAFGPVDDMLVIDNHIIAIVNSMNLDPSKYQEAHEYAWANLVRVREEKQNTSMPVVMMKHIPLLKEDFDLCSSHFENLFAKERVRELCAERAASEFDSSGNVKWQNMMSPVATQWILDEIQPIFIFSGHDHDGCIYRHNEHTVEYTLRSVMGDFGGYTALFEILPTNTSQDSKPTYDYFYTPCPFVHLSVVTTTVISTVIWCILVTSFVCYKSLRLFSSNKLKMT